MKMVWICLLLGACDRVGSEAWCEKLSQKPTGDWTVDEVKAHAAYCVLGLDPEKRCEKLEKKPKGDWTANEASDYTKNCVFGRSEKDGSTKSQ